MKFRFQSLTRVSAMLVIACAAMSVSPTASAQDFDDIYYNPSTAKKQQQAKKQAAQQSQPYRYSATEYQAAADYQPADNSVIDYEGLSNVSVDEYNRRGIFAQTPADSTVTTDAAEFASTRRIQRFYNPDVAEGDEVVTAYLLQPDTEVNIIINNPGYFGSWPRYYGGYWGSPYYYSPSYWYDPFYWNWGPSYAWNWGWGPSWGWNWGWGPSYAWGWGPSWGWAWHPGWGGGPIGGRPGHGVHPGGSNRPGHNGGGYSGPTSGQRPGAGNSPGNLSRPSGYQRPATADGYRPGTGVYPGNTNSGSRPGAVTTRPSSGSSNGTYRPASGSSNNSNSGSYNRGGRNNSGNTGSYNRGGSSSRGSSGGFGGSSGGGSRGGRGRH